MFKRKNNHERGQSLMEMAITLPVLIMILSGLLDLGRLYYTAIVLEEAVAEAALYLAINAKCPTDSAGPSMCADPNNARYRGENVGGAQEINTDITEWNLDYYPSGTMPADMSDPFPDCKGTGCLVVVQVHYSYDFLTPGIQAIADAVTGDGLTLKFQATQIIVFE